MRLPSSLQRLTILLAAATHDSLSSCSVSATKHYQSNNDITCGKIYEEITSATVSPLAIARNLSIPLANSIHDAEFEHSTFWEEHGPLLHDAWREWEDNHMKLTKNGSLTCNISKNDNDDDDDRIITTELYIAINNAFNNPNEITESIVKSLWMTSTTTPTNQPNHLPKSISQPQPQMFQHR